MEEKPKRKMTEKQLANLIPINARSEKEQREMRINAGKKSGEVRRAKIKRENSKDYAWEEYGIKFLDDIAKYGDTKTKAEVLKALFPNDKQISDINFKNLNPDVVVETLEMRKKAEDYTKKLLDD